MRNANFTLLMHSVMAAIVVKYCTGYKSKINVHFPRQVKMGCCMNRKPSPNGLSKCEIP